MFLNNYFVPSNVDWYISNKIMGKKVKIAATVTAHRSSEKSSEPQAGNTLNSTGRTKANQPSSDQSSVSAVRGVQFRSVITGHYIMKGPSGKFFINTDGKRFKGVPVETRIQPVPNPIIDKETADREEKDMIDFLNNNVK
jgi:hypothetical protein